MAIDFSPKQKEVWRNTVNVRHRWNISLGATRSGKTYLDYYKIPYRIRSAPKDGLILSLGNTKGTLERNILEPMRKIWTGGLVGSIGSDNRVTLFGRECYALGADKVNQVSKLQGAGLAYCYGDEVTTWHEDVFRMLQSRLDKPRACFDGTCNPDNPGHWFRAFLEGGKADVYQMTFTIDDNPFLQPEFVEALKAEYSGTVYYDRFIKGEWAAAEGSIYRKFADNPESYMIDEAPEIKMAAIGVDFGGNGSAHAFVCNGITAGWRNIVTLEEYYRKEVISPAQLEQDFVGFVQLCQSKYRVLTAYCDSAEQSLIQGLRAAALKARLRIEIKNAKKGPITDRIRFWCMMQGAGRYQIMRRCKHLAEAFRNAVWDSRVIGADVRLDDGKHNIDSLDACEYSMEPFMQDLIYGGRK